MPINIVKNREQEKMGCMLNVGPYNKTVESAIEAEKTFFRREHFETIM